MHLTNVTVNLYCLFIVLFGHCIAVQSKPIRLQSVKLTSRKRVPLNFERDKLQFTKSQSLKVQLLISLFEKSQSTNVDETNILSLMLRPLSNLIDSNRTLSKSAFSSIYLLSVIVIRFILLAIFSATTTYLQYTQKSLSTAIIVGRRLYFLRKSLTK